MNGNLSSELGQLQDRVNDPPGIEKANPQFQLPKAHKQRLFHEENHPVRSGLRHISKIMPEVMLSLEAMWLQEPDLGGQDDGP